MPYKKRSSYARKRRGRKTTRRVFRRVPRGLGRLGRPNIYHYKQKLDGSFLNGGFLNGLPWTPARTIAQLGSASNYGFEFRVGDLPQWSIFSSLYDMYRLNKIVFELIPMATVNTMGSTGGGTTANSGMIASVIDYDNGSTTLSSLSEYEQYSNCKTTPVVMQNRRVKRVWTPHINIGALASGGGNVGAVNRAKQWIDCTQSTISHHGLKFYIDLYPSVNQVQTWAVYCTYYVSFKSVR